MNLGARSNDLLSLFPAVKCISPKLAVEISTLGNHMKILSSQYFIMHFSMQVPCRLEWMMRNLRAPHFREFISI